MPDGFNDTASNADDIIALFAADLQLFLSNTAQF